jgi:hypothetical protein
LHQETYFPGRVHVLICNRCDAEYFISGGRHENQPSRRSRR